MLLTSHLVLRRLLVPRQVLLLLAASALAASAPAQTPAWEYLPFNSTTPDLNGSEYKLIAGDFNGDGRVDVAGLPRIVQGARQVALFSGVPHMGSMTNVAGDYRDLASLQRAQVNSLDGSQHDALLTVDGVKLQWFPTGINAGEAQFNEAPTKSTAATITGPWTQPAQISQQIATENGQEFNRVAVVDGTNIYSMAFDFGGVSYDSLSLNKMPSAVLGVQFFDVFGDGSYGYLAVHTLNGLSLVKIGSTGPPVREIVQAGFTVDCFRVLKRATEGNLVAAVLTMNFAPDQYLLAFDITADDPLVELTGINDVISLYAADITDDGEQDLVIRRASQAGMRGYISVPHPTASRFSVPSQYLTPPLEFQDAIEAAPLLADFNYDGQPDLAFIGEDKACYSLASSALTGESQNAEISYAGLSIAYTYGLGGQPVTDFGDALSTFGVNAGVPIPASMTENRHLIVRLHRQIVPLSVAPGGLQTIPLDDSWTPAPIDLPITPSTQSVTLDSVLDMEVLLAAPGQELTGMTSVFYAEFLIATIPGGGRRTVYPLAIQSFLPYRGGANQPVVAELVANSGASIDPIGAGVGPDTGGDTVVVGASRSSVTTIPAPVIPADFDF